MSLLNVHLSPRLVRSLVSLVVAAVVIGLAFELFALWIAVVTLD
jgi:hypothetical protein